MIAGTAAYAAAIATMGIGLGFVLRSTASGAGVVLSLLLGAPIMSNFIPGTAGEWFTKLLPSNAASSMNDTGFEPGLLSAGWGAAVLAGWAILAVGAAAISVSRRDA